MRPVVLGQSSSWMIFRCAPGLVVAWGGRGVGDCVGWDGAWWCRGVVPWSRGVRGLVVGLVVVRELVVVRGLFLGLRFDWDEVCALV